MFQLFKPPARFGNPFVANQSSDIYDYTQWPEQWKAHFSSSMVPLFIKKHRQKTVTTLRNEAGTPLNTRNSLPPTRLPGRRLSPAQRRAIIDHDSLLVFSIVRITWFRSADPK
jgi:hypothetical protein